MLRDVITSTLKNVLADLLGTAVSFSLSQIFSNNEPGFTFEPWDITTLYQDRAGTTPVTAAGQSVGLRLDKSKGLALGTELVTNGDFAAGATGWTATGAWAIASGNATATATSTSLYGGGVTTVSGRFYKVEFDVVSYTTGTLAITVGGNYVSNATLTGAAMAAGRKTVFVSSGATTARGVEFYGGAISAVIDNISVKELPGNHQVAVSDAKRGIYGRMPKTGQRNLLTETEFRNGVIDAPTRGGLLSDVSGVNFGPFTTTGLSFGYNGVTDSYAYKSISVNVTAYTFSAFVLMDADGAPAFGSATTISPLNDFAIVVASGVPSPTGYIVESLGGRAYRVSATLSLATGGAKTFGVVKYATNSSRTFKVTGYQAELGSTVTAYQRVASQYDITEAGVPTCYYVQADGVDDAYVTPTITPNTDKVQVFAGVRKLSDAAFGIVVELSADVNSNNGSFNLSVSPPNVTRATYGATSCGSILAFLPTSPNYSAPLTNVVTGTGDISGDRVTLRVNGTQVATSALDQGTGNYLAYPVYIYSRGGTANPFNGLDFGHAVRFGPNLDAATIARVESLIARNTPEVTL